MSKLNVPAHRRLTEADVRTMRTSQLVVRLATFIGFRQYRADVDPYYLAID